MDFTILNLFCTTIVPGIVSSASWDGIKKVNSIVTEQRKSYENLLFSAFIEAVQIHDKRYDETAKLVTKGILQKCKSDKKGCIGVFTKNVSGDYGAYLNSIKTREFHEAVLDDLVCYFQKDGGIIFPELLRPILDDTLKLYTVTALEQLKKSKKDDIQFLQLIKIDDVIAGIERLDGKLERLEQAIDCLKEKIVDNQAAVTINVELNNAVKQCSDDLFISIIYLLEEYGLELVLKNANDYFAIFNNVSGFFSLRIGLYYVDNREKISEIIEEIKIKNVTRELDEFIVISDTSHDIEELKSVFATSKNVLLSTINEFFQKYDGVIKHVKRIETEFSTLEQIYYPSKCYENSINKVFDAIDYLGEIIANGDRVLLLGDYGIGKTFLCRYFTYVCSEKTHETGLVPIYINLENKNVNLPVGKFIEDEIVKTGIHIKNKKERLILFIDGFDLMDLQYDVIDIERSIREIANIYVKRIVVTSRKIFFKNDSQIKRFYNFRVINLKYRTVGERMSYYEKNDPQIKNVLENLETGYTKNVLLELSNTPAFADILRKCMRENQNQNIFEIFCKLIDECNVIHDNRFYLLAEDEEGLLSAIAAKIYCKSSNWLSTIELRQIISEYASSRYTNMAAVEHDIRNSPFLVRTADNRWFFRHGVFQEYFTALTIQNEIKNWMKKQTLLYVFAFRKLPMGILNILSDMKISNSILESIIYSTYNKDFNTVRYMGANAVSILNFRHENLKNIDFSYTVLVDSDFRSADLTGCRFIGANLYTANFDNCILDDCNFINANLLYASMKECKGILDILYLNENEVICSNLNAEVMSIDLKAKQVRHRYDGHINNSRVLLRWNDYIVSGGKDFKIIIWEKNGSIVQSFSGHSDGIWGIDILQEKGLIVSGSSDKTVRVWQFHSEDSSILLEGHDDEVRSVLFVDKNYIMSGGLDRKVILWDYVQGNDEEFVMCQYGVTSMVYNKTKKRLFVGDEAGGVSVLKINTDKKKIEVLARVQVSDCMIRTMDYFERNSIVLGCENGEVIKINGTLDTDGLLKCVLWKHDGAVNKIHVIDDEILSVSYDNIFCIGNLEQHTCIDLSGVSYTELKQKFSCSNMIFSDDVHFSQSKTNYLIKRGACKSDSPAY